MASHGASSLRALACVMDPTGSLRDGRFSNAGGSDALISVKDDPPRMGQPDAMQSATRRPAMPSEAQVLRYGAGLAGVILTASTALSADLAVAHMLAQDAICGASSVPHCGWRLGAAGLGLAGFAAFTFAFQPVSGFRRLSFLQIKSRTIRD